MIRGDLATVKVGRFCHIGTRNNNHGLLIFLPQRAFEFTLIVVVVQNQILVLFSCNKSNRDSPKGAGSVLHPPCKELKGAVLCIPLLIGDFTTIGENCVISATSVGSCVSIGKGTLDMKNCANNLVAQFIFFIFFFFFFF